MRAERIGMEPMYVRRPVPRWLERRLKLRRRLWLVRPAFLGQRRLPAWTAYRLRTYKTAAHLR